MSPLHTSKTDLSEGGLTGASLFALVRGDIRERVAVSRASHAIPWAG